MVAAVAVIGVGVVDAEGNCRNPSCGDYLNKNRMEDSYENSNSGR
jgi:hypothetical protein